MDNRGIDMLENLRLLANPPSKLNDPFECIPGVAGDATPDEIFAFLRSDRFKLHQAMKGLQPLKPMRAIVADTKRRMPEIVAGAREAIREGVADYRIACLSFRPNGILLWAHYAKGHEGFVVGLKMFGLGGRRDRAVLKVSYSAERPRIETMFTFDFADVGSVFVEMFATKSPEWAYEEEVRIIGLASSFAESGGESFVPLERSAIDCVVFGSRCEPALRDKIKSVLRSKTELAHVRQLQARNHEDRFEILVEPIED